ncbi:hypothetical protein LAZ67_11002726 [Cordylochernes scorpioides]|uniref:Uncharacterized protein n=1 Tax=Cordylochernes scorpioides TaxID=51811 RepID=A0ABY6L262_9ARAC|nr:hypothetical protein LAZ67_11002726 [Cordylochernes scorpioides]
MRIQNFITLRNDRLTGQGGGTAIFIHKKQSWSRQSGKLGNVHTKNEDTVALRKFREQIKVELGAKDGEIEEFLLVYIVDEEDLGDNRRGLTLMRNSQEGEFSSTSLHLVRALTVLTVYRQSWSRQSGKLGNVHTKNEDTVALRKFREQIKVELGAKDGEIEEFLLVYIVDEEDLGDNRRGLTLMIQRVVGQLVAEEENAKAQMGAPLQGPLIDDPGKQDSDTHKKAFIRDLPHTDSPNWCMDIKNVRKWCREFNEGRINVHDEQRSGRPSLPESTVARIDEMVRANRRITLEEIEDGLNEDCSHFSVHKIVSETLGYRKVSARWVDKWLKEAAGEWYNTGITKLVDRMKKVIEHQGDYVEK